MYGLVVVFPTHIYKIIITYAMVRSVAPYTHDNPSYVTCDTCFLLHSGAAAGVPRTRWLCVC